MPKISCPPRPLRAVPSEPQMAEQLVEVPVVSVSSCVLVLQTGNQLVAVPPIVSILLQPAQRNVAIPVQGGGLSGCGSLQGSHPGQCPVQPSVEQIVDIPVPGGAHHFLPEQDSTAFCRDGGPGGDPQGFVPGQSVPARSAAPPSSWSLPVANSRLTLRRKRMTRRQRRRRRRRQKRWTLMWCPCAFKPISGPEGSVLHRAWWSLLAGLDVYVCARVPRAPPGRAKTVVMVGWLWTLPVIMQPEFQQSFLFIFLKVPQIRFLIRAPDIPVVCRDGYAQCITVQNTVEISQVQVRCDSYWGAFVRMSYVKVVLGS